MAAPMTREPSAAWSGTRLQRLDRQTTALLNQVQTVASAYGAWVCDNHGTTLAAYFRQDLEWQVYDRLGLSVAQIFATCQARGNPPREIEFLFERGRLLARDLGNAVVVVACVRNADGAILRMTLNVAAGPLEKDADLQNDLKQAAASRADTLTAPYV